MKKILTLLAILPMAIMGVAQAATIAVTNGDFEDAYTLPNSDANGAYAFGAAGWAHTGSAGTFDPDDSSGNIYAASSDPLGRVGFVGTGASLSQDLGTVIAANTDYTLSALFGHRSVHGSIGGTFGFTANGVAIGTTSITDPGTGLWSSQSNTLDAAFLASFIGQQLGIIFMGTVAQFSLDDVAVNWDLDKQVVPLPGAIWLFGSALLGGGLLKRRKKQA